MHVLQSRVLLGPSDFDASVDFFEHQVGLVCYREWGRPGARGVVFFLGGGYLELNEAAAGVYPDGARLWLQVADVHQVYEQLRDAGAAVTAAPERKPWGLIEMVVDGPDRVELVVVEVPADHPLRRDTRS